MLKKVKAVISY